LSSEPKRKPDSLHKPVDQIAARCLTSTLPVTSKRGEKKRKKQARQRRATETRREAARSAKEIPDLRSTFASVEAFGGVPVSEETLMVVVEPIKLPSSDVLFFQSPFIVPFYLLEAKKLRDEAEPLRLEALANTKREKDGTLRPLDPGGAFDALRGLALTVILSAAAIEAYANEAIFRLPDDAMIEVKTRVGGKTIPVTRDKARMDRLRIGEKLTRVVPLLTGQESIKGTKAWQTFRRINKLRNDLVHVKPKLENDPTDPGPFGRLMLGDGSKAPEEAATVIEALEPWWVPEHIRADFGLPLKP